MPLCPLRLNVAALASSPLPVDLALIKTHLAIDTPEFDALLTTYLMAAIAWAEGSMHRTIFSRSHSWVLRDFPYECNQEIRLPRGRAQSVESIAYKSGGQIITLTGPSSGSPTGADYQEDLNGDEGGVVMPLQGQTWPGVDYDVPAPVVISFTAGWLPSQVPDEIIHALLFAASDAFDMRGTADLSSVGRNFETRETLISGYRLHRLY